MNQDNNLAKVFLTVDTFADQNDGNASNGLSLRDAILIAQRDPGKEYVINLPQGTYNLSIEGNEDFQFQEVASENLGLFDRFVARTGDLDIETRITIVGESAANTIIDANNLGDRIFDVKQNGFLTLENVTAQNGRVTGTFAEDSDDPADPDSFSGGGIRIQPGGGGKINNSVLQGNRTLWDSITDEATVNGAAIANRGQLEINDTTIIDNISDANAGGIYNTGTLEILNSSIVNNSANITIFYVDQIEGGGGIQNSEEGTLLVRNSTIAGNKAVLSGNDDFLFPEGAGGGGVLSDGGKVTIISSTIVDNSAPIGGGILIDEPSTEGEEGTLSPATLQNTIVAQNTNVVDNDIRFGGDIEGLFDLDSSYNFIGNGNGILFDGVENNIVGDPFSPLDPQLTPLGFNGGLTPTYAPLDGSPVINAGNNAIVSQRTIETEPLVVDQTGKPRILGNALDIGSVEADSPFNKPLYRFQNTDFPGNYLFVDQQERQNILENFPVFEQEGYAFNVASSPRDDLIRFNRFRNEAVVGTYLYASEEESVSIRENFSGTFREEGIAFYALGADADVGENVFRFRNRNNNTYLFVLEDEANNIRDNFPIFVEEGVAFEV